VIPTLPASVRAYLMDLDRALAGADPTDRAEIVGSVQEHIAQRLAELGHEPAADDVARILDAAGPVEDVAAAMADPNAGPPSLAAPPAEPAEPADSSSATLAVVLGAISVVAFVLPYIGAALALAVLVWAIVGRVRAVRARSGSKGKWTAAIALAAIGIVANATLWPGLLVWGTLLGGGSDAPTGAAPSVVEQDYRP
jgi:hypothetical protein